MAAVVHEVAAIRRNLWFFDEQTRFRKACDRLQRAAIRWHAINVAVAWLNVKLASVWRVKQVQHALVASRHLPFFAATCASERGGRASGNRQSRSWR